MTDSSGNLLFLGILGMNLAESKWCVVPCSARTYLHNEQKLVSLLDTLPTSHPVHLLGMEGLNCSISTSTSLLRALR
jgi:hypothetical protein